jgi:hypothetical protein
MGRCVVSPPSMTSSETMRCRAGRLVPAEVAQTAVRVRIGSSETDRTRSTEADLTTH